MRPTFFIATAFLLTRWSLTLVRNVCIPTTLENLSTLQTLSVQRRRTQRSITQRYVPERYGLQTERRPYYDVLKRDVPTSANATSLKIWRQIILQIWRIYGTIINLRPVLGIVSSVVLIMCILAILLREGYLYLFNHRKKLSAKIVNKPKFWHRPSFTPFNEEVASFTDNQADIRQAWSYEVGLQTFGRHAGDRYSSRQLAARRSVGRQAGSASDMTTGRHGTIGYLT